MTHSIGSKILSQRLTCSPHLHSVIMMNRCLLFAFLLALFCSVNTYALTVEGLYEAEVPIPDQSIQYRKGGIAAALRSVMVKLTGDRNVFGRSAAVDMIKEAERYVQQYEYRSKQVRSRDQLTSEKQLHLWVNFNAKALNDSLRNYAIPVWGQERPSTLVWLASQKDQRRKLITQEDESGYTEILNQRTAQRGIPIVYPLLDLEDTLVLKASDIWGGFSGPVMQASERYGTDAILTGSIEPILDGLWEGRWTVMLNGQTMSWTSRGDIPVIVLDEGIDGLADILAQHFAPAGGSTNAAAIEIMVEGISDYEQYAKVSDYLASLNSVTDVRVKTAEENRVTFEIIARSGELAVAQSIKLGKVLESTVGAGRSYRLLP